MKLSGSPRRIELTPETDEERAVCQDLIDGKAAVYWGDSEHRGGSLILNTAGEPRSAVDLEPVMES